ncbi:hypothetical protein MKX03_008161 [Papaver bracteatum]|nr:hypothetical protein MKX03_008161 [Papaver bracteatum]
MTKTIVGKNYHQKGEETQGGEEFPEKKENIFDLKLQAKGKLKKDKEETIRELSLAFIIVT